MEGKVITDIYRKPTYTGRNLNFLSNSHFTFKKSVIVALVDRILLLFHSKFHIKNCNFIRNTLVHYCYPLSLINKIIEARYIQFLNTNITPIDNRTVSLVYIRLP